MHVHPDPDDRVEGRKREFAPAQVRSAQVRALEMHASPARVQKARPPEDRVRRGRADHHDVGRVDAPAIHSGEVCARAIEADEAPWQRPKREIHGSSDLVGYLALAILVVRDRTTNLVRHAPSACAERRVVPRENVGELAVAERAQASGCDRSAVHRRACGRDARALSLSAAPMIRKWFEQWKRWWRRRTFREGEVVSRFIAPDVRRDVEVVSVSKLDEGIIVARVRTTNVLYASKGLAPSAEFGPVVEHRIDTLWDWSGASWGGLPDGTSIASNARPRNGDA